MVITKCLMAIAATPNLNWNHEEYEEKVIEPYRRLQKVQQELEENNAGPTIEQMKEALEELKCIFKVKRIDYKEQREWFEKVFDEAMAYYLFPDFEMPGKDEHEMLSLS